MRLTACAFIFAGVAFAQNLTEFGAAAAVGSVGGASGKKVTDGLTAILEKVEQQTAKAAKSDKTPVEPALELAPGVVRDETGGVPLPPPPAGRRSLTPPQLPLAKLLLPAEIAESFVATTPVLPPPPEMSREGLQNVSAGMNRADVLRLGAPASKITMFENGHLSETYSYRQQGQKVGTVRLTDGAVAAVEVQ
ncbi:MAG: hypothetical protein EXQ47_03935 [Bryobacterales bacterium]|nr:hypothetical protein [Bryobacterales bacterium]